MRLLRGRTLLVFSLIFAPPALCAQIQPPHVEWERTLGGDLGAESFSVQQTSDGGYIIAGSALQSDGSNDDVHLIKTDAFGNEVWAQAFGGDGLDYGVAVQQTSDGGYIISGATYSFGAGLDDAYLIKTDEMGNLVWSRTFGGESAESGISVQETSDGGYIIGGTTFSFGAGMSDFYVVKTDENGDELWSQTFGEDELDWCNSVRQTSDGGYITTGWTGDFRTKTQDIYLLKTDGDGNPVWSQTLGGANNDASSSVQQVSDGGYVICGGSTPGSGSHMNACLIKTDEFGNEVWFQIFESDTESYGFSVQQMSDGGYVMVGRSGRVEGLGLEAYLVRTNDMGDEVWALTFGVGDKDDGRSVQQTTDGGFIVCGSTYSVDRGRWAVYLVKFGPESIDPSTSLTRGDANADGSLTIADAICILAHLFGSPDDPCKEDVPRCLDAADANDDGALDFSDAVFTLSFLFGDGPGVPDPGPDTCGRDPTEDGLGCDAFWPCLD